MNRIPSNNPLFLPPSLTSPKMHPYVQEAIFATVILGGLFWAYKTVPAGLQEVKDAARSPGAEEPKQPPARQLDPDAENKIGLQTLRGLSDGHSFPLRNAAIKIATQRAVSDDNRKLLLRCLASKNRHHRDNAIRALLLLFSGPEGREHQYKYTQHARFQDKEAFEAIITALVNLLPYHKRLYKDDSKVSPNLPPSPVAPIRRPRQEKTLLRILLTAMRGNDPRPTPKKDGELLDLALEAGLVTKWLAHYPFPCTLPQFSKYNYKKVDVCTLLASINYADDDPVMSDLIQIIQCGDKGQVHLRAAGLKASAIAEDIDTPPPRRRRPRGAMSYDDIITPCHSERANSIADSLAESGDVRMVGGEATAGEPVSNWSPVSFAQGWEEQPYLRQRWREQSQEEVSLRRRNREAVVVAERGEPLGRENILSRLDSGTMVEELDGTVAEQARRSQRRWIGGLDGWNEGGEGHESEDSNDGLPDLEPAAGSDELAAFANAMPRLPEMRTLFEQATRTLLGGSQRVEEGEASTRTATGAESNEFDERDEVA